MPRVSTILRAGVVLLGVSFGAPLTAHAAIIPFVRICADPAAAGQVCETFEFPLDGRKGLEIRATPTLPELLDIADIVLTGVFDTDPFISFGVTTTNVVPGPVEYAITFGIPIVPGFYNTASSQATLGLTPAVAAALVTPGTIYPTYVSGYGTLGAAATNLGVDLGTDDCNAPAALPPTEVACPQGTATNTFPLTFYDNLEVLLTYSQSGLASSADWNARVDLIFDPAGPGSDPDPGVPEPASMLLVGTGLAAVLMRRRRTGRRL